MKFRNIFWGVILVFVGVLFLLQNFDVIHFEWVSLWRLWPVILILWGVSIIPTNNWIKTGLVVLILSLTVYFMIDQSVRWNDQENYNFEAWDDYDSDVDQAYSLGYEDSIPMAILSLDAAAGSFIIGPATDNLLDFETKGGKVKYNYNLSKTDSITRIKIEREGVNIGHKNNKHEVLLKLNEDPTWELNFDAGASAMDFDLSNYKVSKLDIDGGAASFKIKLGSEYEITTVNIDAGASSIEIMVPETSGCDLKISSVLTDRSLKGFEKTDHGHYRTSNFEEAENKIYLNVEAAVSSYSIIRY
ncbi:MAG TPA: DUF5668 domain-containing protein [Bacteroidales bacterium]